MQDFLLEWSSMFEKSVDPALFSKSRYTNLSIIIYAFPAPGSEEPFFTKIRASVLKTWSILGILPTTIVVNRRFSEACIFAEKYPCVSIQESPILEHGNIRSMSLDCILNMHKYFDTEYCLVIQEDGFPLRDTLSDFIGKYDYIGAPINVGRAKRFLFRLLGMESFNGGFSLRSHKICEAAAKEWLRWGRHFISPYGRLFAEDVFFTTTAKLNPLYRLKHKFPSIRTALRFAYDDLTNLMDLKAPAQPFGFHGKTTARQYLLTPTQNEHQ